MTTIGKAVIAIVILIVLIATGLAYYLFAGNNSNDVVVDESSAYDSSLGNVSNALTRDQIKNESFDQTLASFEADLEKEVSADLYDESSYVENSNAPSEPNLTF